MKLFTRVFIAGICLSLISHSYAKSDFSATASKLENAVKHQRRTASETARDQNRKPVDTLEFFRFRDDMTVLELLPGGGWYTRLLAPVLEEKGKLYIAMGAERIANTLIGQEGFNSLSLIPFERSNYIRTAGNYRASLNNFNFDIKAKQVDLTLTFRNLHNFDAQGRRAMNDAIYKVLKPGGLYGVVDHTKRHMQANQSELRRRMDPVQVIQEIEASGFEFIDYSTLHFRADDELRYEVGRKTVTGNTDRFTLLFRRPN
ncbi:MAG: hypothetical protein KUG79_01640 [Pseudomonadales bacterium]|nr:hypothetical protein [Pseudomonadales bacterium]